MSQPPRRNDEALMGENSIRNEEGFMGFSLHSEENLAMGGRQVGGRKAIVMESLYGEDSLGGKGDSCTTKSTSKGGNFNNNNRPFDANNLLGEKGMKSMKQAQGVKAQMTNVRT
jgi:hypothetical protein